MLNLSNYEAKLRTENVGEAYVLDSIDIVNEDFSSAPSYKEILIDGIASDCTVKLTKKSTDLILLFRPETILNKGSYVEFDENTYIILEYVPNKIYPKANVSLCNNVMSWKSGESLISLPCLVEGKSVQLDFRTEEKDSLSLRSNAEINVYLPYNQNTKVIEPQQRFIFNEYAYKVTDIDKISHVTNGKGLIIFTMESTGLTDTDDKENGIPDDSGSSDWSDW